MDPKTAQTPTPTTNQPAASPTQTPPTPQQLVCKKCGSPITEAYFFCPKCGKKIKEPPYKFSLATTIVVILESVLLPPLGLFPGFRYLRMKETGAKILGTTAIVITIIATILMVMFLKNYINGVNSQLNDANYLNDIYNNPGNSVQDQALQLQNQNH